MGIQRFPIALGLFVGICAVSGALLLRPGGDVDPVFPERSVAGETTTAPEREPFEVADAGVTRRPGPFELRAPAPDRVESDESPAPQPLAAWLQDALGIRPGEGVATTVATNRHGGLTRDAVNSGDLQSLAEIIAANGLREDSSPFDYDDGDGVLEPLELGLQVWEDGDLIALSLGPGRSSTFGYELSVLPAAVGGFQALRYLDLHGNALRELPPQLAELGALTHLYLFRNDLTALPDGLGDLAVLEVLVAGENRIERLPDDIERLSSLRRLQLGDNPIAALPAGLAELRALQVLDLARTRSGLPAGGYRNLASILDSLAAVEEVHLTRSEVGPQAPDRLFDGSIPRVYGWTRASP